MLTMKAMLEILPSVHPLAGQIGVLLNRATWNKNMALLSNLK